MASSSIDNHLEQDGLCSVYSAQPSETNCSISEVLGKEIIAVNELSDDGQKSETNVTLSDGFEHCEIMKQFNNSTYSVPKSETNVTLNDKFERCPDLRNVLDYSVYSAPPSETNVTMNDPTLSEYTALASETNVTMAEGFHPCHAIGSHNQNLCCSTEYTATSGKLVFDNTAYVEHLQAELGIPDEKIIGLECSNLSITKIIDSNECLLHLDQFQPIPVNFGDVPEGSKLTDGSVESYLLRSVNASSIHHEI